LDALLERTSQLLADARRGRIVREGLQVAIIGAPNVGKSSLFNALVGADRAIVTDTPGTTRDLVTESVDIGGVRVTFIDTAGIRDAADVVEAEGVARSRQAQSIADLVLVVVDKDEPEPVNAPHLLVQSKVDLDRPHRGVRVSAKTGQGVGDLRLAILSALDVEPTRDRPEITNVRHATLLSRARDALARARAAVGFDGESLSEEFVLIDLQVAREALEEITGRRTSDELLGHVFSRFCVGK
jgi:tRNA modification GTPase